MPKLLIGGIAIAAVLSAAVSGYRLGAGAWPDPRTLFALTVDKGIPSLTATGGRKVLYWKDPDGANDFSPEPKKRADGRDYVPVYDDQEPDFAGAEPKAAPAPQGSPRKLLYYRNPMGLPDTSPVPKKDWMGMDYIPVYEGEEQQDASTVKVSLEKVQRSGVRTAPVEMRRMARPLRAPGVAKLDERTLRTVSLRADGFIEKLYVSETGYHVKAGERLFRVYSPDILRAAIDTRREAIEGGKALGVLRGEEKLRNYDVPEAAIAEMRRTGHELRAIDWPAPVSGVVIEKKVVEGQMARMGEELYRLADLSSIWVIADVAEQDLGQIRLGAPAKVSFRAFPGQAIDGRVTFILHELDMKTRTAKVRIEVKNLDHRIKHEMFADVEINAGANEADRLVVPISALIDSGNRQVVLIDRGEGRFEPRAVKLGARGDGFVEITEGVKAGDQVVVAANFLIDAESNLKAALSGFTAEPSGKTHAEDQK